MFIAIAIVLVVAAAALWAWQSRNSSTDPDKTAESLPPLQSTDEIKDSYDVIVAGTDPEGVAAALSAARNGLDVLLVDGKDREILGGLITLGWLNSLDLNYSPQKSTTPGKHNFLNKGIFQQWYDQLEGTSIDVNTAATVFQKMVQAEPNISLLLKVKSMKPALLGSTVTGLTIVDADGTERMIAAKAVIDATQDADIAVMAGVPYTKGHEDIGSPEDRMAVTLVFKMSGLTQKIWESFGKHKDTGIDKMSAWGFPEALQYESTNPERVGLRGLNIGRLNDNTILINAMHIFGIDPLDPASVEEGFEIGRKEAPRIVEYLKTTFKEFENMEFAGTAPELYIRETVHTQGEYRLTIADLMENRDFWDAIAYGSYSVDIQRLSNKDFGTVIMKPIQYGVPFRTLVPLKIDQLLVVGRSASFDTLPHGSARVIPLGMATAEAAGVAAKMAIEKNTTFRELSKSEADIKELRSRLVEQGMDLTMVDFEKPAYTKHEAYPGLLAAVSMQMTAGGYDNDRWDLDGAASPERFAKMMARFKKMHPSFFPGNPEQVMLHVDDLKGTLSLEQAAVALCVIAGVEAAPGKAVDELLGRGWITDGLLSKIDDRNALTNGDAFMLVRDVAEYYVGVVYQ